MFTKKILSALMVSLMCAGMAMAQTAPTCSGQGKQQTTCCAQSACEFAGINLTDAQKTKLQSVTQAPYYCKQGKKAYKKQLRVNARKEQLAQIKSILTPEQYVKYLENCYVSGKKAPTRPHHQYR